MIPRKLSVVFQILGFIATTEMKVISSLSTKKMILLYF